MKVTTDLLKRISVGKPSAANVLSIVTALNLYGTAYGLDQPHRLAQYIAQLAHESGGFIYDKEIASGSAYEGRKDLGNTHKGDGVRYKGRGPIQITGRANYAAFTKWAKKLDADAPDFIKNPELVNTDPWEGLAPIWYWDEGNPDKKNRSLNYYADQNDIEMVTRLINGGINGLDQRIRYYERAALIILGYGTPSWKPVKDDKVIRAFQGDAVKAGSYKAADVDGASGPRTRTALHQALLKMADQKELSVDVAKAPVVEIKKIEKTIEVAVPVPGPEVAVPVKVTSLDKSWVKTLGGAKEMITGAGVPVMAAVTGAPWQTILAVGALAGIGVIAYILIRNHNAKKQDIAVQQIKDANALPDIR